MAGILRLGLRRPPPRPSHLRYLASQTLTLDTPPQPCIALFWDLATKPPTSLPLYDAALRLRLAASSLGPLRLAVAYATSRTFRHPSSPSSTTTTSHPCRVCGRNFYNTAALLHHFRLHEREHAKRLRRIASATGARRVALAAQFSLKNHKFDKAARELLAPHPAPASDELGRAGVLVHQVPDRPDAALRAHMIDAMDKGKVGCLMLVSNNAGFASVLREARARCLRTVVVGDEGDGELKRCADASFSWEEVKTGKARKEGRSTVGKWDDRDLLRRMEWKYVPEPGGFGELDCESERESRGGGKLGLAGRRSDKPWWNLDTESSESEEERDLHDECHEVAGR